jgi:hypothetical protein
MIGQRYGHLTVIAKVKKNKYSKFYMLVECDCGTRKIVGQSELQQGKTTSCTCERTRRRREKLTTHGMYYTPEYNSWIGMKGRCNTPSNDNYDNYGGRGIRVCDRWKKFENFYEDMGPKPDKEYTIERIDNNGNYESSNCRWATQEEQSNNKRNNRLIFYNNKTQTVAQWAKETGLNEGTIRDRLDNGWIVEDALEEPPMKGWKKKRKELPCLTK